MWRGGRDGPRPRALSEALSAAAVAGSLLFGTGNPSPSLCLTRMGVAARRGGEEEDKGPPMRTRGARHAVPATREGGGRGKEEGERENDVLSPWKCRAGTRWNPSQQRPRRAGVLGGGRAHSCTPCRAGRVRCRTRPKGATPRGQQHKKDQNDCAKQET